MQKTILLLLISLTVLSCRQNPTELQQNLTGYWEIEKVVTQDGEEKTFKVNAFIDYITLEGTSGKRTKVSPQLDGTFKNNETVEPFEINTGSGELLLRYTTQFNAWTEKVKKATQDQLVIINNEGKEYHYKRFKKFSIM